MKQEQKRPWYDLFNGNIRDPAQFTFAYLLVTVLLIGILLIALFSASPHSSSDLQYVTFAPECWVLENDTLSLFDSENALPYRIWDFSEVISAPDALITACEDGILLHIGYCFFPNAEVPYNRIEAISSQDGSIYLTLEQFNAHYLSGMRFFYILYTIILLCWLTLIGLSIHIGRNPQKYSRRLVLWFFKEHHLK